MRMSLFRQLKEDLVRDLQRMLYAVHPLVRELKTCLDTHLREDIHQIIIRADRIPQGEHPGRHNTPNVDEVAVLLVGQEHGKRDIVLKKREGGLQRISENHREGVILSRISKSGTKSLADVGLTRPVKIDQLLPDGTRVTLKLYRGGKNNKIRGKVISKEELQKEAGLYWGYSVRLAKCLSDVFVECPYDGEYDFTIGTSDKGESWEQLELPSISHGLIVFGGVRGLEFALSNDKKLSSVTNVAHLFNSYLNTCPHQGARTIRTEEAVLISLALLTFKFGFK